MRVCLLGIDDKNGCLQVIERILITDTVKIGRTHVKQARTFVFLENLGLNVYKGYKTCR